MEKRALLLDSSNQIDAYDFQIHILPSLAEISGFLEYESFSGDELAFLEDGEEIMLSVKHGREYKDIFGRKKVLSDFKYIEASRTGDFSRSDTLKTIVKTFLARRGVYVEASSEIEVLIGMLVKEIGLR